jgi:hypothetical protein
MLQLYIRKMPICKCSTILVCKHVLKRRAQVQIATNVSLAVIDLVFNLLREHSVERNRAAAHVLPVAVMSSHILLVTSYQVQIYESCSAMILQRCKKDSTCCLYASHHITSRSMLECTCKAFATHGTHLSLLVSVLEIAIRSCNQSLSPRRTCHPSKSSMPLVQVQASGLSLLEYRRETPLARAPR